MNGVVYSGGRRLSDAIAPLHSELASLHWAFNIQRGVWSIPGSQNLEALDQELDGATLEVPALASSGTALYRAGTLPRLLQYLTVDEWAYYYGFVGSAEDAVTACTRLSRGWWSYLQEPPSAAKLLVVCVCPESDYNPVSTWVALSSEDEWLQRLRLAFPCRAFDAGAW